MNILKSVLTTVILTGVIFGCKEKEVFPSETQDGLNTFGVKIDNSTWLPERGVSVVGAPKKIVGYYFRETGTISITARKGINDEIIQLIALDVKQTGNYAFNSDSIKSEVTKFNGKYVDDIYYLISGGNNELNISKLDTVNQIISGNFKMQLKGIKSNKTKNFTHGVFDIKYEK